MQQPLKVLSPPLIVAVSLLMSCVGGLAQDNHPQLMAELQTRIQPIIAARHPDVVVRVENNTLIAEHDTREWTVYGVPLYGEADKEPHQERGPNRKGFRLTLQIKDGRDVSPQMLPRSQQMPYWKTFFQALPLNVVTPQDKLTVPTVAPDKPDGVGARVEYPDVPQGHWAYEVLYRLSAEGIIEGLPAGNYGGQKAMTRYEFAVAMARLLDKWELHGDKARYLRQPFRLLPPSIQQRVKSEKNWESVQACVREFAAEIERLGFKLGIAHYIKGNNVRYRHLWVEFSAGANTDLSLWETIKNELEEFAFEKHQATTQVLKEN